MKKKCDISIITPSFNMLVYLKQATASIADQVNNGVNIEHLVIDNASTDGTAAWLEGKPHVHMRGISEADNGMYDAINKGLKLAKGNILAYLNCDEQYLPGTLSFVKEYFERNPGVDIIFGDALLTRPDGTLVAYRKGYQPRWFYILVSHLYVLSCTMFFRGKILEDGFCFDTRYQAAGDMDFVVRVLRSGYKAKHIKRYFAAFTMTGKNLGNIDRAVRERKQLLANAPFFIKKSKWLLNAARLAEKFSSGAYFQEMPLEYPVYTTGMENQRKTFRVNKASSRWRFE